MMTQIQTKMPIYRKSKNENNKKLCILHFLSRRRWWYILNVLYNFALNTCWWIDPGSVVSQICVLFIANITTNDSVTKRLNGSKIVYQWMTASVDEFSKGCQLKSFRSQNKPFFIDTIAFHSPAWMQSEPFVWNRSRSRLQSMVALSKNRDR